MKSTKNVVILAGNLILAAIVILAYCFDEIDGKKLLFVIAAIGFPSLASIDRKTKPQPARAPKGPSLLPVLFIGVLELATGSTNVGCISAGAAKAGDLAITKACEAVTAVTDDGTAKTICATATELADMGALIAEIRESDPPASSRRAGPPPMCRPLPQTTVCATNTERLTAINAVLARRSVQ